MTHHHTDEVYRLTQVPTVCTGNSYSWSAIGYSGKTVGWCSIEAMLFSTLQLLYSSARQLKKAEGMSWKSEAMFSRRLNLMYGFTLGTALNLTFPLSVLLFAGVAFGQSGSSGAIEENIPIQFVSMFSSDADVNGNRTPCQHVRDTFNHSAAANDITGERPAVCDQILDIVAGKASSLPPEVVAPIHAAKVAIDLRMRVLITEPTTRTVHILDFASRKYTRIDGAKGDRMYFPYAVASDASNNIYVTDLVRGRIAVYSEDGKFKKFLGRFKNEGAFDGPQSIAIDRSTGRIYVADTKRNFVLILDRDGKILAQVGRRGGGNGPAEFQEPIEIAIYENEVFVLDKQNNRIQVLDLQGHFRRQFTLSGSGAGDAHGMAFDTKGRLFIPSLNWVEVFDRQGEFLFRFGQSGDKPGEFRLPNGICTDAKDRVYVMDSGNHRIQVFQIGDKPKVKTEVPQ